MSNHPFGISLKSKQTKSTLTSPSFLRALCLAHLCLLKKSLAWVSEAREASVHRLQSILATEASTLTMSLEKLLNAL